VVEVEESRVQEALDEYAAAGVPAARLGATTAAADVSISVGGKEEIAGALARRHTPSCVCSEAPGHDGWGCVVQAGGCPRGAARSVLLPVLPQPRKWLAAAARARSLLAAPSPAAPMPYRPTAPALCRQDGRAARRLGGHRFPVGAPAGRRALRGRGGGGPGGARGAALGAAVGARVDARREAQGRGCARVWCFPWLPRLCRTRGGLPRGQASGGRLLQGTGPARAGPARAGRTPAHQRPAAPLAPANTTRLRWS
jgi:hypothetical protein